jgi:lipoprotein-anchoring transpeptidase ErfK/SrfK
MGRAYVFTAGIGNDFVISKPKPKIKQLTLTPAATPAASVTRPYAFNYEDYRPENPFSFCIDWRTWSWLHFINRNKVAVLTLLLILTAGISSQAVAPYWYTHLFSRVSSFARNVSQPPITIDGKAIAKNALTLELPAGQAINKIHSIISQPVTVTVGDNPAITVNSATINSWIQVAENNTKTEDLIEVDTTTLSNSINQLVNQYVVAPVNSVVADEAGTPVTILPGTNGAQLASPNALASQISSGAKNLLSGKGLQFSALLVPAPSQVSPLASFGKLLDVNVTTKRMYAFDNGQLANTFLVTAGAPATPTPIGEFHIWEKLPVQNMSGYNPNGTKYYQPNVPWINYFDHSGDAVHGNYWRPANYFGNINSSHGCVGLQITPQIASADGLVSPAEWVYEWAPIGTTVITHV